jgi:hypothetical protein
MGFAGMWLYGKDLGSAIETAETVIAKIKTNKFSKADLAELDKALTEIRNAVTNEA